MERKSDESVGSATDPEGGTVEGHPPSRGDPERYRHLVEHIQDALVEFEMNDGDPVIRDVNPAFEAIFGYDADDVVGASLNDYIVPPWLEAEANRLDDRTGSGEINYRHVRRSTASGLREFLYRGIPYETADGRRCGFAVYTDLTEDRRNQSRIEVLHRLLRHNLRNTLGVLVGSLDQLVATVEGEGAATGGSTPGELARRARESARDLETLAEEAHEIQRTLDAPVPEDARVDCASLAADAVEQARAEYPAATVSVESVETAPATATERLALAVEELLTNAIVHNPDPDPRVWVEVGPAPESGWTDVVVADDGPRIPEADRLVVSGEAEITSMQHGTGLGLWLVRWTVEQFGGTVSFGNRDGGGNEVRLRLPR